MSAREIRRARAALGLMAHSIIATKLRTVDETVACNLRFTAARDFLLNAPAHPIVGPGIDLSAEEMEEERGEALSHLRALCGACGLCARFGLRPP